MLDNYTEQLFQMIERCKKGSRAASSLPEPREWYLDKDGVIVSKPLESKAASVTSQRINKVKIIANFLNGQC